MKVTVSQLYKRTCEYYQKKPEDAAATAWIDALTGFGMSEVESALNQHEADYTMDNLGRTKGSYMPFASDLVSLIMRNRSKAVISNKFRPCGKCDSGWVRTFDGMTVGSDDGTRAEVDKKIGAVEPCQCRIEWRNAQRKSA